MSLDIGPVKCASLSLRELHQARLKEFGIVNTEKRLKRYQRYVYEAGTVNHAKKDQAPEEYAPLSQVNCTGQARVIDNEIVEHERENDFELNRMRRFRYRTRYFTDSGIIGTKEFVSENYQRFKDLFMSKREKIPKRVVGLDGIYSLKRLAE